MFKFIFYLFSGAVILYERWACKNFGKESRILKEFNAISAEDKNNPNAVQKDIVHKTVLLFLWHMSYFLWTFIGLFTFQWYVFCLFFILSAIRASKKFSDNKTYTQFDALFCIFLSFFMVINTYHLHIFFKDILKYIAG